MHASKRLDNGLAITRALVMKLGLARLLSFICGLLLSAFCHAQQNWNQGYFKNSGAYVSPHWSTAPNDTNRDNWSTSGNRNPYTGSTGTRAPDYSIQAQSYGAGRIIYTGPRGGQYYINSNGKKTYVPKR